MATYGLNGTGNIPFTGWTNSLGNGPANVASSNGTIYNNGINQGDDKISKLLRRNDKSLVMRRLMASLLGVTVGSPAVETKKRVQWEQGSPGGLIPIESVTLINRATTAADVTALLAMMFRSSAPTVYVVDASGNGGGGKQTAASGGPF